MPSKSVPLRENTKVQREDQSENENSEGNNTASIFFLFSASPLSIIPRSIRLYGNADILEKDKNCISKNAGDKV